ncbi:hypothetical protein SUDANB43_05638 [Streptomyces sp. enrichment culture]
MLRQTDRPVDADDANMRNQPVFTAIRVVFLVEGGTRPDSTVPPCAGAAGSGHGTVAVARASATAGAVEWGSRSRGSAGSRTSTSASSQKRYGRCSR